MWWGGCVGLCEGNVLGLRSEDREGRLKRDDTQKKNSEGEWMFGCASSKPGGWNLCLPYV